MWISKRFPPNPRQICIYLYEFLFLFKRESGATNQQALSPENTVFANYYGLPAISILCGFDKHGLPLGLQIVGKPWNDGAVLQLAHQYEISTEYGKKHPIR